MGSKTIDDSAINFVSASQIFATFNLSGAKPGSYTLSVQQGSRSANAPHTFQVTASTASNGLLAITISMPQTIRAGRSGTVVLSYTNTTNNDMTAPLLNISSSNANITFSTPDDPNDYVQSAQLLAVAPSGPAGILRPGQSGQLTLTFRTVGTGGETIPISVQQVLPGRTIDWASEKAALQPSTFSDAAWNVVWNSLMATVGTTTDSYGAALAQAAGYLGGLGATTAEVSDVNRLCSFLVAQANASFPPTTLASAVDASLPTPGSLSLSIGRTFGSTLAERNQRSVFGLGWVPSWQASIRADAAGNVSINTGNALAYFVALPNGAYLATDSEYGTLAQSGGNYVYTNTAGTEYVFLANGNLNYEQDGNGNRITFGYNAQNQLVTMTYSNVNDSSEPTEQLTLAYYTTGPNTGLVQTVSDGTGNTWKYNYDGAGHLTSVVAPGTAPGSTFTTSYTYDIGSNPETANALLSITNPIGSQVNYTYNSTTGRLTGTSQTGGAEPVSYAYPNEAEVTITDAAKDQSTTWYNDLGLAARFEDPLGDISSYAYDINGNLVSYTNPAGDIYQYRYDTNGDRTQTINPLGQTVQMTYGPLSKLTSTTDADGNTTQFQYSAAGNLLNITYPDGTQQSFNSYDPLGDFSETVLQNGDPINYQYNAQGLVKQETFADGTSQTYTYDANGNMLTASPYSASGTLPDGSVQSFQYSPIGFLVGTSTTTGKTTTQANYLVDPTGDSNVAAFNGNGSLIANYTYGLGLVMTTGSGGTGYYDFDASGNTVGITGSNGTYVNQYSYLPFGQTTNTSANPSTNLPNPFTFSGQTGVMQIDSTRCSPSRA